MEGGPKYFGERTGVGCSVYVKHGLKWVPLPMHHDRSSSFGAGFEWGYMCSGAARLSLALLTDHLKNKGRALELYEEFEFLVVASLNRDEWLLSGEEIDEVIASIEPRLQNAA